MSWMDQARAAIAHAHETIPADADLATRKRALRSACPGHFRQTSWGRKVWPKAVKEYLKQFDPVAKSDAAIPARHLSPLERMMRRAGQ
jgi:hypothetical protein